MNGWKTYVGAALGFLVGGLYAMEWINLEMFQAIEAMLGFLGIMFIRHGMKTGAGKKEDIP